MAVPDLTLVLRPATLADAELLLAWRNDPEVRRASHDTAEVDPAVHRLWLAATLADPDRRMFIAEDVGNPVGTVRADWRDGAYVLSWTVAPEARGRGVGTRMVAMFAAGVAGPLRAEVKAGNPASARIAAAAGLTLVREADGVLCFVRPAVP